MKGTRLVRFGSLADISSRVRKVRCWSRRGHLGVHVEGEDGPCYCKENSLFASINSLFSL